MNTVLDVTSGICWSIVYIVAIILGIKHKTSCIPSLAICQNFAWEFWVVVNRLCTHEIHSIAFVIQLTWLLLDVGILIIWLLFGKGSSKQFVKNILLLFLVMLIMFFLTLWAEKWEFTAFLINAIMSLLFIIEEKQKTLKKNSVIIAISKLVGTLAATILNGIIWWNPLILWLGGICFFFDCYYWAVLRSVMKDA